MTRIIATALVAAAAFTGTAQAMVSPTVVESQISIYAPNADLDGVSNAKLNTLLSIVHSGDTESEKRSKIRALVN